MREYMSEKQKCVERKKAVDKEGLKRKVRWLNFIFR